MLSNIFGNILDKSLGWIVRIFPFPPNIYTFLGLTCALISTVFIIDGSKMAVFFIALSGLFDILDGVSARINNKSTDFGAFLDSVIDRFSDSLFFIGLSTFFFLKEDGEGFLITITTMAFSVIISYIRARAEGIGRNCKVGIIERPERIILICLGILSGMIKESMMLLGLLSFITIFQRIFYVYSQKNK
ncbi:MAG: CDP-alcohol phosphatidyltransferase family protein [Proteobacteria bacterium]|nr:CDP-alcohol phosphatidyltransferase family protein [Pseudomonadota bacterium]